MNDGASWIDDRCDKGAGAPLEVARRVRGAYAREERVQLEPEVAYLDGRASEAE